MEPDAVETKKKLIHVLLPTRQKPLQIAFIHSKNADTSSWTYGHELGRRHVEQVFGDQIQTCLMDRVSPGEEAEAAITRAVDQGCRLIFTTTPEFLPASLKLAVEHPEVSIYNCSVNTAYHSIRTYYGRMYEAKFLCGMVAGALADNNRIGYIADYPIYGMTANINAFAFGARMVNPRAKVYLQWSSVKDQDSIAYFKEQQISYLSTQDMIVPQYASRQYGLYRFADLSGDEKDSTRNAAMPLWNWGQLYERIVQNSLNSTHEGMPDPGMKALNYWWGLATGTIDFIYNKDLEAGTKKLVEFFRRSMESGAFHPFEGRLESQEGVIQEEEWEILSPEEIITMDWLASNVIGRIPDYEELTDAAKAIVRLQGIKKQK
jgi:basic membrane lipoprotein Med (substrate-binding protein (PBP1-ABC) superfamily)